MRRKKEKPSKSESGSVTLPQVTGVSHEASKERVSRFSLVINEKEEKCPIVVSRRTCTAAVVGSRSGDACFRLKTVRRALDERVSRTTKIARVIMERALSKRTRGARD